MVNQSIVVLIRLGLVDDHQESCLDEVPQACADKPPGRTKTGPNPRLPQIDAENASSANISPKNTMSGFKTLRVGRWYYLARPQVGANGACAPAHRKTGVKDNIPKLFTTFRTCLLVQAIDVLGRDNDILTINSSSLNAL